MSDTCADMGANRRSSMKSVAVDRARAARPAWLGRFASSARQAVAVNSPVPDANAIARQLRIREAARFAGLGNRPPADAAAPSAVELGITHFCRGLMASLQQAAGSNVRRQVEGAERVHAELVTGFEP